MESNMTDTLKIEAGKEYLLEDGAKMICYATGVGRADDIHGAIYYKGDWHPRAWNIHGVGVNWGDHSRIISPAPETIEVDGYLALYANGVVEFRGDKAATGCRENPIISYKDCDVTFTIGEGM
jgi:hypothetical protein